MADSYALGYSAAEQGRLALQARIMRPWTAQFLRSAGLEEGMTVLDVGSGLGDVALLAAEIVGPIGRVIGLEQHAPSVEYARKRISTEQLSHVVDFELTSLDDFDKPQRFDALVGRFILQYLPNPSETLRRLTHLVKPGGIIVFHEMDCSNERPSWPPCALWDECYALLAEMWRMYGVPENFGHRLVHTFLEAGLRAPTIQSAGFSGGMPGSSLFTWLGLSLQVIRPRLESAGIALPADIAFDDTLASTLEQAVADTGSQVLGPLQWGAWTRV
ncbi:SAM-dependent methyltransferase [Streptomyces sp. NPDC005122]